MSNVFPCGYYEVGDNKFFFKNQALYESAVTGKPMRWDFNDQCWSLYLNNNRHLLGTRSLDELYKQRALQLRDKYDYLILNYSGGADSHNILMTFLNNNIKLDEIYVQHSKSVDTVIYTPNMHNRDAENIHSEWDFVIKPALEMVSATHPDIKINIHDVFEKPIEKLLNDDTMLYAGHYTGAFEILRQTSHSSSIPELERQGKTVADIYGIDKPVVLVKDNNLVMFFTDIAANVARHSHSVNSDGNSRYGYSTCNTELFYWSIDMPEIAFEQAYKHYLYFKENPHMLSLVDVAGISSNDHVRQEAMRRLSIDLIYTTWNHDKFQVNKPMPLSQAGRTRDRLYLNSPEFSRFIEIWNHHSASWNTVHKSSNYVESLNRPKMMISSIFTLGNVI